MGLLDRPKTEDLVDSSGCGFDDVLPLLGSLSILLAAHFVLWIPVSILMLDPPPQRDPNAGRALVRRHKTQREFSGAGLNWVC